MIKVAIGWNHASNHAETNQHRIAQRQQIDIDWPIQGRYHNHNSKWHCEYFEGLPKLEVTNMTLETELKKFRLRIAHRRRMVHKNWWLQSRPRQNLKMGKKENPLSGRYVYYSWQIVGSGHVSTSKPPNSKNLEPKWLIFRRFWPAK